MCIHLAELFGVFEAICTAIRGILAFEVQVSASLTRDVSVALDLATLTLIAMFSSVRHSCRMLTYRK